MFLSSAQIDFAIDLLESAVDLSEEESDGDRILPLYNLGLAHLVGDEVSKAHEILKKVDENLNEAPYSSELLSCLLLPEFQADGVVSLTEEFSPDFHEVVRKALNSLDLS